MKKKKLTELSPQEVQGRKPLKITCPNCKNKFILEDMQGWFFIILRHTLCPKCHYKITDEEVYNES